MTYSGDKQIVRLNLYFSSKQLNETKSRKTFIVIELKSLTRYVHNVLIVIIIVIIVTITIM